MDNSAALRLIFRKKKKLYFSVLRSCSPCILILMMFLLCYCKEANALNGARRSTWALVKFKIWAVPCQALQHCFSFFPLFYFSDNFNFKILINYSKAFDSDVFFYRADFTCTLMSHRSKTAGKSNLFLKSHLWQKPCYLQVTWLNLCVHAGNLSACLSVLAAIVVCKM